MGKRVLCWFAVFVLSMSLQAENLLKVRKLFPYPEDTRLSQTGTELIGLDVAFGQEGLRGAALTNLPLKQKTAVPFRLAFWARTLGGKQAQGQMAKLGCAVALRGVSGKKYYPSLYLPFDAEWRYHERVFPLPEPIAEVTYIYVTAYHFSGRVEFSQAFAGPWNAQEAFSSRCPVLSLGGGSGVTLKDFRLLGQSQLPESGTEVTLRSDASGLRLSFRCASRLLRSELQMRDMFKSKAMADGIGVLSDDSVEWFIEGSGGELHHMGCNSRGRRFYQLNGKTLPASWQVIGAVLGEGEWRAEAVVPWSALGFSGQPSRSLRFSVGRNDPASGEYSSWCALASSFHDVDRFAELFFSGGSPLEVPCAPLVSPEPGVQTLSFRSLRAGRLVFELKGPAGWRKHELELEAGSKAQLPLTFEASCQYEFRYSFLEGGERLSFRSPWRKIQCEAALPAQVSHPANARFNGRHVPSDGKILLRKGRNEVCAHGGELRIASLPWAPAETVVLPADGAPYAVELGMTGLPALETEDGLHWERDGVQHLPFKKIHEGEMVLMLRLPPEVRLLSCPTLPRKPVTVLGKPYHEVEIPWTRQGRGIMGLLVRLSAQASEAVSPLLYRCRGKHCLEVWNCLPLRVLPAIEPTPMPRRHVLELGHSFSVGAWSAEEAEHLLASYARCGINSFWERLACYGGRSFWLSAARKAGMMVTGEMHLVAVLGLSGRIETLSGKPARYVRGSIETLVTDGRERLVSRVADYVRKNQFDRVILDLEYSPLHEFDASLATRRRFAAFAKLSEVPEKSAIKGAPLYGQWADFCAGEMARLAEVIRAGVKQGRDACQFGIYSSYQSEKNREIYAIDWRYYQGIADYGSAGYGRPSLEDTRRTRQAAGSMPFHSDILVDALRTAGMRNLGNGIVWRALAGYEGTMLWTWMKLDGLARSEIARAARWLAAHEAWLEKGVPRQDVTVSGALRPSDVFILRREKAYLVCVFNFQDGRRHGELRFAGRTLPVTVQGHGLRTLVLP